MKGQVAEAKRLVRYENGLVIQGDTLLEVLDKNCRKLRLPVFIRKIAPKAMEGLKEICLEALVSDQVESWRPLLCARRAVLQIHKGAWIPLSHTGGFEAALPENGFLDFQAYDSRFLRIQDRDLKLEMAISRFLYPVELEEKACVQYEQLLKNRFRPASLQVVSGKWNRYGVIPDRAGELLRLKKIDRFLKKELLEKAAFHDQPAFAALILEITECSVESPEDFGCNKEMPEDSGCSMKGIDEGSFAAQELDSTALLWKMAAGELYRRKPEMELFCGMLKFCPVEESFSLVGTDGFQIYYSKQFLSERKDEARLYTHMLLHCLYLHPFSGKEKGKWTDLACDIAVEYVVDRIFGPSERDTWERQWVYDTLRRAEPVLTAERIEEQLLRISSGEWLDRLAQWFACDDHCFWANRKNRMDDSDFPKWKWKQANQSEAVSWRMAVNRWTSAGQGLLQTGQKKAGKRSTAAGHEQEEAKLIKRQGYDYHDFLRQFMVLREDRILDLDSYDPVYYTYGLNTYGNIPLVEPLETKEVMRLEELVIVIDTSGSCSGKLVRFFLEETWSVFGQSENFFDQFQVRILQCDAVVQEDVKLTNLQDAEQYMKNLVIKGGGGTDFREAFSYIRGLQKRGELMHLKGILYFTDGFGTYPAQPPGCKTAFIFLKARFGQVEVPYWADKLLLELPEGADWEPEYTGGFQVNIR